MSVTINISVGDKLADVLLYFNQIQILRASSATDTFVEITTSATRINLSNQDSLYQYIDTTGTAGQLYKTRYFHSSTLVTGPSSPAFIPVAAGLEIDPAQQLNNMAILWNQTKPLSTNMQISVTLSSGIADVYGDPIGADLSWYFLTKLEPVYCSAKEIDLDIGAFISEVPEDTVYVQILRASLEANAFTFKTAAESFSSDTTGNESHFKMIRKNWTICRVSEFLLLNQLEGTSLSMKRLGDLTVTYRPEALRDAIQRSVMCQQNLLALLKSHGNPQVPRNFIKGIKDPDRPTFGRTMVPGNIPAVNIGVNRRTNPFAPQPNGYRFKKTFFTKGGIEW